MCQYEQTCARRRRRLAAWSPVLELFPGPARRLNVAAGSPTGPAVAGPVLYTQSKHSALLTAKSQRW